MMEMVNVDLMRSTRGVSTRKVTKITEELCGTSFSKSTVSRLCEELDVRVGAWNERPLKERRYPFLVVDAMQIKVRRDEAVRRASALLAVGINGAGYRELLGLDVAFGETGEAWRRFIRGLKGRGLSGVVAQKFLRMATSDAHKGLRQALEAAFPGLIWQRCHTEEFLGPHFRRNVLDRTPAALRDRMHELLDRILTAPSPERAREAVDETCAELEGGADKALEVLETGWEEATAVLALPKKYRRRLRTTNMLERFIEEIRRREKVVRIFHRRNTCVRRRPTASSAPFAPNGTRNGLGPVGATSRWTSFSSGRRPLSPRATRYP